MFKAEYIYETKMIGFGWCTVKWHSFEIVNLHIIIKVIYCKYKILSGGLAHFFQKYKSKLTLLTWNRENDTYQWSWHFQWSWTKNCHIWHFLLRFKKNYLFSTSWLIIQKCAKQCNKGVCCIET